MFIIMSDTNWNGYIKISTIEKAKEDAIDTCEEIGEGYRVLQELGHASKEIVSYTQAELPFHTIPTDPGIGRPRGIPKEEGSL